MSIPFPHEVFAALARPRLIELAASLHVSRPTTRSTRELVALLSSTDALEHQALLRRLSLAELRAVCAHLGFRHTDGDVDELVARLTLEGDVPLAPPPAAPAPAPAPRRRTARAQPRGELGFEATLWQTADRLRSNMDAAEYKHVVLGLIFLKFISEAGPPLRPAGAAAPRTRGFHVPPEARWPELLRLARAGAPDLGHRLDLAMAALEAHNPTLRAILPQIYRRLGLESARLAELLGLVDTIDDLGAEDRRERDVLGRVYEYFLTRFAAAEGKNGGQFYTPPSVVGLLVAMLAPTRGTVYDPACGSGGMFVQSERFFEDHGGARGGLRVVGQESNPTTWRLARMNLAIRGVEGDLGPEPADSFARDLHPDLRADYVLANPPFNARAWGAGALADDPRFGFGLPPDTNANFAWVQHILHHLAPRGLAGFVLANGALTVGGREGEIRRRLVEADLVDCVVALPAQLFYSTTIPVSLWLLARDKSGPPARRRRVLMIDARDLGAMVDRTHRALAPDEIARVAAIYHAWRGEPVFEGMSPGTYADVPGRCRAVDLAELAACGHVLAPSRHVPPAAGAAPARSFAEEFAAVRDDLLGQLGRAAALDEELAAALARVEVP